MYNKIYSRQNLCDCYSARIPHSPLRCRTREIYVRIARGELAIVVGQGRRHADYDIIEELFSVSLKGERYLCFLENYGGVESLGN